MPAELSGHNSMIGKITGSILLPIDRQFSGALIPLHCCNRLPAGKRQNGNQNERDQMQRALIPLICFSLLAQLNCRSIIGILYYSLFVHNAPIDCPAHLPAELPRLIAQLDCPDCPDCPDCQGQLLFSHSHYIDITTLHNQFRIAKRSLHEIDIIIGRARYQENTKGPINSLYAHYIVADLNFGAFGNLNIQTEFGKSGNKISKNETDLLRARGHRPAAPTTLSTFDTCNQYQLCYNHPQDLSSPNNHLPGSSPGGHEPDRSKAIYE